MKTLYFECNMGAAGDMLTAALLDLFEEEKQSDIVAKLNAIAPEGVEITEEKKSVSGIAGKHVHVLVNGVEELPLDLEEYEHLHGDDHVHHHDHEEHEHHHEHEEHDHHHDHEEHEYHHDHEEHEHHHEHEEHEHYHEREEHEHHHDHEGHTHHHHHHFAMSDVSAVIDSLDVSDKVKADAKAVYQLIAEAESHAHGKPVNEIHFHEVGNKDAIADVVNVCYLMDQIGADKILASAIHVGAGNVRCAHGIMPVPAPATEYLLRGIPYYQGNIRTELYTPTGAALLKYFVSDFGPAPVMNVQKTGIGCGTKEFEQANCVRAILGETTETGLTDTIIELRANLDDMTAEEIGFAMDKLFEAGAKDVFITPIQMKKNRPGTMMTVLCREEERQYIVETFFKYTTTIGIRENVCSRYVLKRDSEVISTEFGDVAVKTCEGYGVTRRKVEFDDAAAIAEKNGLSVREVREKLL